MKTTNKALARILAASLLAVFLAGPLWTEARAGDGKPTVPPKPQQINAIVVRCDETTLVVGNKKGKETTFTITIETRFGPKGTLKNPEDFKAGNHVHITYIKGEGGKLVVQEVVPVLTHVIK